MNKPKIISRIFATAAILLSNVMCAVVAYSYCDMLYGGEFKGYSAPAWVAFFYAIPYAAAIILCVIVALVFNKKAKAHQ